MFLRIKMAVLCFGTMMEIVISQVKSGQVIYMNAISSKMFKNCRNLTEINFKNIDTSAVVDMSQMFYAMDSIKTLDLSSFNTSNVEDVSRMSMDRSS